MPTLSLCMIVKNEQDYLQQCLQSVQGVVDQIVINDTGSTDTTLDIAKKYNAHIIQTEWRSDFSFARNAALEHANGDWVLHLDADETLAEKSKHRIKKFLSETSADAINLPVRSFHPETDMLRFKDSMQIRLFKNNPKFRYVNPIHEQIYPSIIENCGQVVEKNLIVNHYGYQQNNEKKAERNLSLLQEMVRQNPDDAYLLFKLGETTKVLGQSEKAKQWFLQAREKDTGQLSEEIIDIMNMRLAQIELMADNYQMCIKYAQQSLQINKDNHVSLYLTSIGNIYLGKIQMAMNTLVYLDSINGEGVIEPAEVYKLISAIQNMQKGGNN